MVFGNKGDSSCSGVAFSRDEVTGESTPSGDFLVNAQGEDVVSGVRNPRDLHDMKELMSEAYDELLEILRRLEGHYEDMQDTEFTVEEGSLFMSRRATPSAPPRRPCGLPSMPSRRACWTALVRSSRSTPTGSTRCCTPRSPATPTSRCSRRASPASPGADKGAIVFPGQMPWPQPRTGAT